MRIAPVVAALLLAALAGPVRAVDPPAPLTKAQQDELRRNWAPCLSKLKGPYTENFCVCANGEKLPVQVDNQIRTPCGLNPRFCAAFRAPWAEALGRRGMWIANLFSPDLLQWDTFADHHALVRGYILEQYFTNANPAHKLAEMRAYGGLAGAEYEAADAPRFFERYLSLPDWDDARHYLLSYELQRRYYVRNDQAEIQKIRLIAIRIQQLDPRFKPLRDMTHNQLSAALLPKLQAFRDKLPAGAERTQVDELMTEIGKLVSLDESALRATIAQLDAKDVAGELSANIPDAPADPVDAMTKLALLMANVRKALAGRMLQHPDERRLVDVAVIAGALVQRQVGAWLDTKDRPVSRDVEVLDALLHAAYGAGLLATSGKADTRANDARAPLGDLQQLRQAVATARENVAAAFADVWAPWTFLLPQVSGIVDDVLRSSPLAAFANVARPVGDRSAGAEGHLKQRPFIGNFSQAQSPAVYARARPEGEP